MASKELNRFDLGVVDMVDDQRCYLHEDSLSGEKYELPHTDLASILVELYREKKLPDVVKKAIVTIISDCLFE